MVTFSVVEKIVFLLEWKHAVHKFFVIYFSQSLTCQLKKPVKRQEILHQNLSHQCIFWFPGLWMGCPQQIELEGIPSQRINVVIHTLSVLFKTIKVKNMSDVSFL